MQIFQSLFVLYLHNSLFQSTWLWKLSTAHRAITDDSAQPMGAVSAASKKRKLVRAKLGKECITIYSDIIPTRGFRFSPKTRNLQLTNRAPCRRAIVLHMNKKHMSHLPTLNSTLEFACNASYRASGIFPRDSGLKSKHKPSIAPNLRMCA